MHQREVGWCKTSIVTSEVHPGAERLKHASKRSGHLPLSGEEWDWIEISSPNRVEPRVHTVSVAI